MKTGTTNGLSAIVLMLSVFATGCAHFDRRREPASTSTDTVDQAHDGASQTQRTSSKKKDTFYFNDQAYEIAEHLERAG